MEQFDDYSWEGITYPQSYCRTLFDFARERQFKRGLEIGFDQGASALALLRGSPEATLQSIDIYPCESGLARIAQEPKELRDRHMFLQEDSRVSLPKVEAKFDLIYIDGDHLYDAVAQDIANCAKLLEEGGVMVVDDADPNHSHFGVYRAVQEFCVNNPYIFRMLEGSPSSQAIIWHL